MKTIKKFFLKTHSCVYKYHVFTLDPYRSIWLNIASEIKVWSDIMIRRETRVLRTIKKAHIVSCQEAQTRSTMICNKGSS